MDADNDEQVRILLVERHSLRGALNIVNLALTERGYREDAPGGMPGGEDATAHEWATGHPYQGTDHCFMCVMVREDK